MRDMHPGRRDPRCDPRQAEKSRPRADAQAVARESGCRGARAVAHAELRVRIHALHRRDHVAGAGRRRFADILSAQQYVRERRYSRVHQRQRAVYRQDCRYAR